MLSINTPAIEMTVTFADIEAAAERIEDFARSTPVFRSRLFDREAGTETSFKCENLQRGGAFKIRGAANFLLSLSEDERARGVVAFSSGNHAQAVAMAAWQLGVRATIVMPTDAPKAKLESTKAYAPEIVFFDRQREKREEIAARIAAESGATVIPSYDHPLIVAGQGTAALEFLREVSSMDALAVPLGGGGLLSGCLIVARQLAPKMKVFGVEPELANDWEQSLVQGSPVEIAPPATIADGLRTLLPGTVTFPIVKELAEAVITVTEAEIKQAVRFLLSRMKLLVEPSGAVAAAAALAGKLPRDGVLGIMLSGGNIDYDVLAAICGEAA